MKIGEFAFRISIAQKVRFFPSLTFIIIFRLRNPCLASGIQIMHYSRSTSLWRIESKYCMIAFCKDVCACRMSISDFFIWAHVFSIGLKSGEYSGKKQLFNVMPFR